MSKMYEVKLVQNYILITDYRFYKINNKNVLGVQMDFYIKIVSSNSNESRTIRIQQKSSIEFINKKINSK